MALTADPTFTPASANNNVIASTALTNSGGATPSVSGTFAVALSGDSGAQGTITTGAALWGCLQVWNTAGSSITAGTGVQVSIYRSIDGTTYGSNPYVGPYVIATVASTKETGDYDLPPGLYKVTLTNLDATDGTTVQAMLGTTA